MLRFLATPFIISGLLLSCLSKVFGQDTSHVKFKNIFAPTNTVMNPNYELERRVVPLITIDFEHPYYVMDDIKKVKEVRGEIRTIDSTFDYPVLATPNNFNGYLKCIQLDTTIELTDKQKELIAYVLYYRNYYSKLPLKFDDCVFFNPSENTIDKLISWRDDQFWHPFPEAFRFYATPMGDTVAPGIYNMKFKLNIPIHEIVTPFYFKKATITNKEYREFTKWVTDSLMHLILSDYDSNQVIRKDKFGKEIDPPLINWKAKIDLTSQEAQEATADLFLPEAERFYKRRAIDTRKLNYCFFVIPPPEKGIFKYVINVYPDTLVWVHDFAWSFLEPLTNMYYWHPAYDDYPVVGISREQAIAYLNWKTIQEQKKLDKEGKSDWVISYELPTEYEWEMVESADKVNDQQEIYPDYFRLMSDYSYLTDLSFNHNFPNIPASFNDNRCALLNKAKDSLVLRKLVYPHAPFIDFSNYQNLYDPKDKKHYIHREPLVMSEFDKNDKYVKQNPFWNANYDCNSISFMGGNVSEWMQESYGHNWKKVYNYRHNFLQNLKGKDAALQLSIEDYYSPKNDTAFYPNEDIDTCLSYLVRGANWYDRRTGVINGKNIAGMNTKVFISPDSAHCTLGFRYVIKLHRRDEKKIIDSLKSTIHYKPEAIKKN